LCIPVVFIRFSDIYRWTLAVRHVRVPEKKCYSMIVGMLKFKNAHVTTFKLRN